MKRGLNSFRARSCFGINSCYELRIHYSWWNFKRVRQDIGHQHLALHWQSPKSNQHACLQSGYLFVNQAFSKGSQPGSQYLCFQNKILTQNNNAKSTEQEVSHGFQSLRYVFLLNIYWCQLIKCSVKYKIYILKYFVKDVNDAELAFGWNINIEPAKAANVNFRGAAYYCVAKTQVTVLGASMPKFIFALNEIKPIPNN